MSKRKERFSIDGMSCGHCVAAVENALNDVGGAVVDEVAIGSATVVYDDAETSYEALRAAIEEEGYTVTERRTV